MSKVVVAGVASLAVHLAAEEFPVSYAPVRQPSWVSTRYQRAQIAAVGCGSGGSVPGLRGAVVFAGWRIGHREPTSVLLTGPELAALRLRHPVRVSLGWWDLAG